MEQKRELEAKDLIFDIRAGMTDTQLMQKYRLSYKGLHSVLKKLLKVQAIGPEELYERFPLYEEMTVDDMRKIVRAPISVPMPVYEASTPHMAGEVRNISEKGVGVRGIQVRVGECKNLVIEANQPTPVGRIIFEGQCRWVKKKFSGEYVAGFEITEIAEEDMERLCRLMQMLGIDD